MGDPFSSSSSSSAEQVIQQMKLEYLGELTRDGKTYHRVRSWAGDIVMNSAFAVHDWLIDVQSLLPIVCESSFDRCEFSYAHINEPIAPEAFQSPATADIPRNRSSLKRATTISCSRRATAAMAE